MEGPSPTASGRKFDLTKLSRDDILSLTDNKCNDAYSANHWKGQISLPLYPYDGPWKKTPNPKDIAPTEIDFCSYLGGKNGLVKKLYFCPTDYPPIKEHDDDKEKESKLKAIESLIKSQAKKAGSPVVVGRSALEFKIFFKEFVCMHCNANKRHKQARKHAAKSVDQYHDEDSNDPTTTSTAFRESHLVNNKMNGRRRGTGKGGKHLKRRRNRAILTIPCDFHFKLKVDSAGFFISLFGGAGSSQHQGHPKFDPEFMPTQKSSLTGGEVDDISHVNNATANNGTSREFMSAKFDKFLSLAQIRYLNNIENEEFSDEYETLLEAFKNSDDIRYNVLYSTKDESTSEDLILTSTKVLGQVRNDVPLLQDDERESLRPVAESALEERKARGLEDDNVFHCITWAHEKVLRYFFLCPEVVTFDVTSHTNKNGFHLLTFSCRTSVDKQVVFCRVWLPDQRRASFRYVFQEGLRRILPAHVLARVRFVICDGDPQQNAELRIAIKLLWPKAIIGGCSFHMFGNGWNRHVGTTNWDTSRNPAWMSFVRQIHSWMYSWTRPGYCHTQEEYNISKHLLIACLTSKHALMMAGKRKDLIARAIAFIKGYVFPNEDLYLFYPRSKVFNLCVATTSAHEGTNHGLKSHAAAVKATHAMNTAAKAMSIQDRAKRAELDQIVGRDFRDRDKSSWSNLPTGPHLLTYAEGLVVHSHKRAQLYKVRRVGRSRFQVVYVGENCDPSFVSRYIDDWSSTKDDDDDATMSTDDTNGKGSEEEDDVGGAYCPRFSRAYTVDLNDTCSSCDCDHFQRAGFPCPHMTASANAVCDENGTKFEGFGHHSVSVRWWTNYMYWGYRCPECPEEKEMPKLFHHLAKNDAKGPQFCHVIPSSMRIKPFVEPLPAVERIKNYPKAALPSLLQHYSSDRFDMLLSETHHPSGSQELEASLDDDYVDSSILEEQIDVLRASSDGTFEDIMDELKLNQQDVLSVQEVDATRDVRAALKPVFNEACDLLQQCPEEAAEFERMMKSCIANMHKTIAEKKTAKAAASVSHNTSTSPTMEPTATDTSTAGKKRSSWKAVTSKDYNGPPRVKVAKNSKFSS